MFSVRGLVERLKLFERNRVPFGFRVLGLAMYIQALGGLLGCCLNTVGFLRRLFGGGLLSLGEAICSLREEEKAFYSC